MFILTLASCSLTPYKGDIVTSVSAVDNISNPAFGDRFPPGASLGSACEIREVRVQGIDHAYLAVSSTATLANSGSEFANPAAVVYVLRPSYRDGVSLLPAQTDLHQFAFSVSLDTGEMFTGMTELVRIRSTGQ